MRHSGTSLRALGRDTLHGGAHGVIYIVFGCKAISPDTLPVIPQKNFSAVVGNFIAIERIDLHIALHGVKIEERAGLFPDR